MNPTPSQLDTDERRVMQRALDDAVQRHDEGYLQRLALTYLDSDERETFVQVAIERIERSWPSLVLRKRAVRLLDIPEFVWALFTSRNYDAEAITQFLTRMMSEDRVLDVKMARLLPARGASDADDVAMSVVILRVLDVLDRISSGARILMLICHLTSHADCNIASKAAKLVGRRLHSRQWLEKHLTSSDDRVRANVLEALWRTRSDAAQDIFSAALRDRSNRVVGNALIGLHHLGDRGTRERVRAMLVDPRPEFRRTGVWVSAEIGDPWMLALVERAQLDDDSSVRAAARRALAGQRAEAFDAPDSDFRY